MPVVHPPLVHMVVPSGIDDTARPSGGNHYDRRVMDELAQRGWTVQQHPVSGTWPAPDPADRAAFDQLLADLPDDAVVLVDGLIATAATNFTEAGQRLRLVVLLHMPFAEAAAPEEADTVARGEAAVLRASAAVITTSGWTREWIVTHHGVPADRVWSAPPGVDRTPPPPLPSARRGRELLCVGPLVPSKGQDVLVEALCTFGQIPWTCRFVGATDPDPGFVTSLLATAQSAGIDRRLIFTGVLSRPELAAIRAESDLVIAASRHEAFGMAVTEALAAGVPVIASDVGGHGEALGQASDGTVPGMLVSAGDPDALRSALRQWWGNADLRYSWRHAAKLRRSELTDWAETARIVASVLDRVATDAAPPSPTL